MKDKKQTPKKNLTYQVIFFSFTLLILLFESMIILLSGLRKGIFKKEVLSKKSNVGFDFKIIIR